MKEAGIENVLALRGDRPKDFEGEPFTDFHYASELVEHIKARGDNPKAMQQAGIAYATDQIIDLIANGIHNIHVYSMNKPEVAAGIQKNLSEIIHD